MTCEALETKGRAASRAPVGVAWSIVALALALTVAGWVLATPLGEDDFGHFLVYDVTWAVVLTAWAIVGALIASRQPHNPIGWVLCGLTLFAGLGGLAEGYLDRYLAGDGGSRGLAEAAAWLSNWGWLPLVFVPLVFLPLYFPRGRLLSRRWRIVPAGAAVGMVAFWFSEAFASGPLHDYPEIVNPYGIDHSAVEAFGVGSLLLLAAVVASIVSVVIRFRRAKGAERQQIKWLAYAGCLAVAMLVPASIIGGLWSEDVANVLVIAGVSGVTVAVGVAILRHRLYDIDLLINRTLVYGGLTAIVVAIYVALVAGLAAFFHESADFWLALVATGLAALLVQPLRSGLQRRVNRVMYGPGGEGTAAWSGLRGRLHEAFAPEAAELQRARERLVAAREEERRRLRRDLHDGLGPSLAGAALRIEAAGNMLPPDHRAGDLLAGATTEIQAAVADVRRLVYALRPPALDELGLVGAVREHASRLGVGDHIRVDVDAPERLEGLPAAVEVAAYRISLEALTNAAKHAHAHTCVVRICVDGGLELEITDDGDGIPSDYHPGVGMASMRERAEELGGTCEIERAGARGTRVHARLPAASV